MRFHIKSSSYHHYACTMPTMPTILLYLFITTGSRFVKLFPVLARRINCYFAIDLKTIKAIVLTGKHWLERTTDTF